ncbi:MAG: PAS domain S-box protein, partial [Alphaproteobacteria bacterium]
MLARRRGWLRSPAPDEDLFGRALDATHSPRLITAADGRALFTNSAFRALFGDEPHAPLRALGIRIRGGVNGADLFERLMGAIESGEPRRAEALFETTDGRTSWFGVTASPIAGYPGHLLWCLEDATARREMAQVVQDEQQRLFQFFEHAPVGFYAADADGRLRHINRALAEWLGTSPEAVSQARARLQDFVQGPVPAGAAPYDPFGAGGSVAHGEVLLRGRGGRAFRAEIRQAVSGLGAGLRARAVVRNLTHEREVEDALRRSEWRFRKFAENAPVGVALLDLEGRVIEHNKALAAMAGREELGGVALTELVRESDRAEVAGRTAEAANGAERGASVEARFAGERAPAASFYMSRVERDDGTALGLSLHVLDMTEQKNLEVQFAHAQKMQAVGQLAGGIAHDFNNVLTAMIGFCDLLLLRHRPGEQSFADIMHIKQNSNRAASLVRQLLAFSRQQTLQPRVLDLTDVLAELSHLLRRLIGENIELKMVHGRDLGLVRCDQSQFEQVVINLAVNARDAMPSGGTLTIRTSNASHREVELTDFEPVPPGDYVRIDVTDTGMGIPPENLGR